MTFSECSNSISKQEIDDVKNLRDFLVEKQLVILRDCELSIKEQISLTKRLGEVEPAWEDEHPDCPQMQLLDSRRQVKISQKSSSKYWHVDRSFMMNPTRFTVLHGVQIGSGARGTEFLDARDLYSSFSEDSQMELQKLTAIHDFSYRFPDIMRAKGYAEERIDALSNLYPQTRHPLVRKSKFGHSLYFNELCVSGFENVDCAYGEQVIDDILKNMRASVDVFKQVWEPGDTVIWDNFSCIHRASSDQRDGLRILHRTTAI